MAAFNSATATDRSVLREISMNETGSGEAGSSSFIDLEPSLPLCIALSAFGGFLEVSSTMCLAFPEYKSKLGTMYTKCQQRTHMIVNLCLMAVASVAYIVGSFYGPVALSVPTVMVSKLLLSSTAEVPWCMPERPPTAPQTPARVLRAEGLLRV